MAQLLPVFDSYATGLQPLVDDEDYDRLRAFQWRLRRARRMGENDIGPRYFVIRRIVNELGTLDYQRLENDVLGKPGRIAHKNGDDLDFTRANLILLDKVETPVSAQQRIMRALKAIQKGDAPRSKESIELEVLLRDHVLKTVKLHSLPH